MPEQIIDLPDGKKLVVFETNQHHVKDHLSAFEDSTQQQEQQQQKDATIMALDEV